MRHGRVRETPAAPHVIVGFSETDVNEIGESPQEGLLSNHEADGGLAVVGNEATKG